MTQRIIEVPPLSPDLAKFIYEFMARSSLTVLDGSAATNFVIAQMALLDIVNGNVICADSRKDKD